MLSLMSMFRPPVPNDHSQSPVVSASSDTRTMPVTAALRPVLERDRPKCPWYRRRGAKHDLNPRARESFAVSTAAARAAEGPICCVGALGLLIIILGLVIAITSPGPAEVEVEEEYVSYEDL